MSEKDQLQVKSIIEFISLVGAKFWFSTLLADSAVIQDLDFMSSVLEWSTGS